MTYHKIRNVPLEVCTAEQMVAYNIAFAGNAFRERRIDMSLHREYEDP